MKFYVLIVIENYTGKNVKRNIKMNQMILNTIENQICDWLIENCEPRLKDFFLADLSWATTNNKELEEIQKTHGYATNRVQAVVDFFTTRKGKIVYNDLPEDIKNYISSNI